MMTTTKNEMKMPKMTLNELLESYDWESAFHEGNPPTAAVNFGGSIERFSREDVAEICHSEDGENDGPEWVMVCRLNDGRWVFLEAGCDCTGWDCQASGRSTVAGDYESIVRFGCNTSTRRRLNITIPELDDIASHP